MKFFTVFAAVLSVAMCSPASWSLHELSAALQDPATSPAMIPYLENGLNALMDSIFAGHQVTSIVLAIPAEQVAVAPAVESSTWTLEELSAALQNPSTDPALMPHLEHALNEIMDALFNGESVTSAVVSVPVAPVVVVPVAQETSIWTLNEISTALSSPTTNQEIVPYLETALNTIMSALFDGQQMETILISMPVVEEAPTAPAPIVVAPVPAPVAVPETPVAETPAAETPAAPAASSPLVQIIVNINQNEQQVSAPAVVSPAPALVESAPVPVHVVEQAAEPVIVVEQAADPIQIVEQPLEPVSIVEVGPVQVVNPIDVIAVGAPELIPVVAGIAAGGVIVGPAA